MSNTLSVIQTVSKIGRILSRVSKILCAVASALCLSGIVVLAVGMDGAIRIGGVTIRGLIESEVGMTTGAMYLSMTEGILMTAAAAATAHFAEAYFNHELAAGTPFTFDGARELLYLGILIAAVPLAADVAAGIIGGIVSAVTKTEWESMTEAGGSVTTGLAVVLMSFVCKYGAEREEQHKRDAE